MRVVVAIDSLKGSLSSMEVGEAVKSGVLKAIPEADVVVRPLADGDEGRLEEQTIFGKAPIGVAKIAKKHDKAVIAFSSSVTEDVVNAKDNMISSVEQVFSYRK